MLTTFLFTSWVIISVILLAFLIIQLIKDKVNSPLQWKWGII